jgi:ParB family chromosome partitioning protein
MTTTRFRDLDAVKTRRDVFQVDPQEIIVRDGWNPRTDFTGEEELRDSIIQNGVITPLRVRRKSENQIILVDGERRLRATLRAIKEGHDIVTVPCLQERPNISDVEALLNAIVANQGKPLDPVEEAEAYRRLHAWGLSPAEIGKRIGKSDQVVRQRLALVDASFEVKSAVKNDEISIKTATNIVRESGGDLQQQSEQLKSAPRKNNRRPRRALIDIIIDDQLPKLTDDELTSLVEIIKEKYHIWCG